PRPQPHTLRAAGLQFADGVFRHVYTNIVDHLTDVRAFAAEAHRVLGDGGRLWVDLGVPPAGAGVGTFEVRNLRDEVIDFEQNVSTHFDIIDSRTGEGNPFYEREIFYTFRRRAKVSDVLEA
ncbi:unnamed protein product, partial [Prorocentrum cordatum]